MAFAGEVSATGREVEPLNGGTCSPAMRTCPDVRRAWFSKVANPGKFASNGYLPETCK